MCLQMPTKHPALFDVPSDVFSLLQMPTQHPQEHPALFDVPSDALSLL